MSGPTPNRYPCRMNGASSTPSTRSNNPASHARSLPVRALPLSSVGHPAALNVPWALTTSVPLVSETPEHENVPSNPVAPAVVTVTLHAPSPGANDAVPDAECTKNVSRSVDDVGSVPMNDVPPSANPAVGVVHANVNDPGGGA